MRNHLLIICSLCLLPFAVISTSAKEIVFANGDVYEGKVKQKLPNGTGTMHYANGDSYSGDWVMGERSGQGTQFYANGDKYTGQWLRNERNGHGIYVHADGGTYTGEWLNDKRHGIGTLDFSSDDAIDIKCYTYVGTWEFNRLVYGTMTNSRLNYTFSGYFERLQPYSGSGRFSWMGGVFEGDINEGKLQSGIFIRENGDRLEGTWKDGEFYDGKISEHTPSYQQEGTMHEGLFTGYLATEVLGGGILAFEGDVKNSNEYSGSMTFADGSIYKGTIREGMKEGNGTFETNGFIAQGLWREDKFVRGAVHMDYRDSFVFDIQDISSSFCRADIREATIDIPDSFAAGSFPRCTAKQLSEHLMEYAYELYEYIASLKQIDYDKCLENKVFYSWSRYSLFDKETFDSSILGEDIYDDDRIDVTLIFSRDSAFLLLLRTNISTDDIPLRELANSLFAKVWAEKYKKDGHLIYFDKFVLEYDHSAQTIIFCGVPLENAEVSSDVINSHISVLRAAAQVSDEYSDDEYFEVVESMPTFPGGQQALFAYLSENIKYPVEAQKNGVEGRAVCQFLVEKDGSISHVEIVRTSGNEDLDNEALRVVSLMPNWTPGMQQGKPVRVRYTIPCSFKLE